MKHLTISDSDSSFDKELQADDVDGAPGANLGDALATNLGDVPIVTWNTTPTGATPSGHDNPSLHAAPALLQSLVDNVQLPQHSALVLIVFQIEFHQLPPLVVGTLMTT